MKRDMDLVRKILLFTEALPPGSGSVRLPYPDASQNELEYHAMMLVERGLLKKRGGVHIDAEDVGVYPDGLTFEGHDFLDAIRNDTVWRKTMDKVTSTLGSASFEIIKSIAEGYAKQLLGMS